MKISSMFLSKISPLMRLKNEDLALILTYIRQNFKNNASAILPAQIERVRQTK